MVEPGDVVAAFARTLPRIRARVRADLARPGLRRAKVLATVVRLLETTLIRVGNEAYARTNGSFGLTTMRARHVAVRGLWQLAFGAGNLTGLLGVRFNEYAAGAAG